VSERPDAIEVSNRALVLYAIARRGAIELVVNETGGDPLRLRQAETARKEQDRWLSAHELTASLTEVEATLLAGTSSSWPQEAITDALWRRESLGVLLWALHHLDEIVPYGEEFDPPALDAAITRYGSVDAFRAEGVLRSDEELERAWGEADAWLGATEGRAGDDARLASIAAERSRALSWLLGTGGPA
jgi:hypothetical protein